MFYHWYWWMKETSGKLSVEDFISIRSHTAKCFRTILEIGDAATRQEIKILAYEFMYGKRGMKL